MNYTQILKEIYDSALAFADQGRVSSIIPELAGVDPSKFGIHLVTVDGIDHSVGDSGEKFSIQSVSKVLSLSFAFTFYGENTWERVGVEPSGTPFNSLVQLEYEKGKPRNPFINAGAIVVADMLLSRLKNPKAEFLEFVRFVAGIPDIHFNEKIALSEKMHGHRNAALANLIKSFGNLQNDVADVLDFYFHQCAIEMTCRELAHAFSFLANAGKPLGRSEGILTESQIKRLNAVMQTCGFYDESGEFTYKVGLPGKSGIGGGIVAVHPKYYSVATWGPRLNEKGNSILGMRSLEMLTTKTGMSIF